ncbi:MAG: hypothetical protein IT464_07040 [Planctomycetes bacterium]|nr:hypothetical protein [Planctomycetota bacterium]
MRFLVSSMAALIVLLLAVEPAVDADEAPKDSALVLSYHTTEHYRLGTDADAATAAEYKLVLEACWPLFEAFFGGAPKLKKDEKLDVFFLATQAGWQTKMKEDGVGVPAGAGGYYNPGNKTVYLWKQPTLYTTRQLLIHEAMHQFHYIACCNNVGPKDVWYIEGIVEHMSRHYWDGKKLTLGVIPFCSLEDYPKLALELFSRDDYDLDAMVSGTRDSTRPEQWALVRYLLLADEGKHAKNWAKLCKKLDSGQSAKNTFKSTIGDPKKLKPQIREWLGTQQEPFVPVWNEWQGQGSNAVHGTSTVTSACRTRVDATEIGATFTPPEGTWKGGLLVYESGDEYTVALLNSGGGFSINRRAGNAWTVLASGSAPAHEGSYRLKAVRNGEEVTISANDTLIARLPIKGSKLGVCLENCTLAFSAIEWK